MELYCTGETWSSSTKKGRAGAGRPTPPTTTTEGAMLYFLKANSGSTTRVDEKRIAGGGAARTFSSRCARLVKEQRARFYIVRRCVVMLICWSDYP